MESKEKVDGSIRSIRKKGLELDKELQDLTGDLRLCQS